MGINAGDVLRVTAKCLLDEQSIQNVFYCLVTTAWPDLGQALDDIQSILSDGYALIKEKQTDHLTSDHIGVHNITQDETYGEIIWTEDYPGGTDDTSEYLPGPVCALGRVGTWKPRVQGRKFLAGFTETNLADGKWGGGVISDVGDFMEWFYLTTHGAGDAVCDFGLYNPDLDEFNLGHTIFSDAVPAYQRRRRIGVGS